MDNERKIKVKLIGRDGNAFSIIGTVMRALKKAGMAEKATEYKKQAMASKSYDALLCLTMDYVDII